MSLRDQILAADDLPRVRVSIPEWGVDVWVKMLTTREREQFEKRHIVDKMSEVRERLIVATTCDEDGALVFTDADIAALSEKNSKAADRIFEVALTHNGLRADDIESLKKNSETAPRAALRSA